MTAVRTTTFGILAVPALGVIVLNWMVVWRWVFHRRRTGSWIPLLGGLAGSLGILISPSPVIHAYWWVPLLLDWGCVPGMTITLAQLAIHRGRED